MLSYEKNCYVSITVSSGNYDRYIDADTGYLKIPVEVCAAEMATPITVTASANGHSGGRHAGGLQVKKRRRISLTVRSRSPDCPQVCCLYDARNLSEGMATVEIK
ncbi:MAG: hypothetical protein IJT91_02865 [Clostridia bacterium]|nr:hypothetical protein [Clostridia bacterium]